MIKQAKKESSARVCHTFDSNLEKIAIKEKKPEGEVNVKILDQLKNIDLIIKQERVFVIDKDARLMYMINNGEFYHVVNLFHKEYYGMVQTPETSEIICLYGNDGVGKDNNIVVKFINIKVSLNRVKERRSEK